MPRSHATPSERLEASRRKLRETMLARALKAALPLMSNRCRLMLYENHGQILRWLQEQK